IPSADSGFGAIHAVAYPRIVPSLPIHSVRRRCRRSSSPTEASTSARSALRSARNAGRSTREGSKASGAARWVSDMGARLLPEPSPVGGSCLGPQRRGARPSPSVGVELLLHDLRLGQRGPFTERDLHALQRAAEEEGQPLPVRV